MPVLVRFPPFAAWAQIQEVQSLRVSVSLEYINLRNQRHRKMRQQLAALRHCQQQHAAGSPQHVGQQQQQPAVSAGGLQAGSTSAAAAAGAAATGPCQGAAAAGPAASLATGVVKAPHSGHMAVDGQAVGRSVSAAPAAAAAVGGDGWCMQRPGFQHQVLSTVQYMAFVHALRRFFDRAVAVARCVADAQF